MVFCNFQHENVLQAPISYCEWASNLFPHSTEMIFNAKLCNDHFKQKVLK